MSKSEDDQLASETDSPVNMTLDTSTTEASRSDGIDFHFCLLVLTSTDITKFTVMLEKMTYSVGKWVTIVDIIKHVQLLTPSSSQNTDLSEDDRFHILRSFAKTSQMSIIIFLYVKDQNILKVNIINQRMLLPRKNITIAKIDKKYNFIIDQSSDELISSELINFYYHCHIWQHCQISKTDIFTQYEQYEEQTINQLNLPEYSCMIKVQWREWNGACTRTEECVKVTQFSIM